MCSTSSTCADVAFVSAPLITARVLSGAGFFCAVAPSVVRSIAAAWRAYDEVKRD